jgi:hypothetical protein
MNFDGSRHSFEPLLEGDLHWGGSNSRLIWGARGPFRFNVLEYGAECWRFSDIAVGLLILEFRPMILIL